MRNKISNVGMNVFLILSIVFGGFISCFASNEIGQRPNKLFLTCETQASAEEPKTVIVGIHFQADGSNVNVHVTSKYSEDIKALLRDDRSNAGYWWYLDELTGHGIQLPPIIPTVYKYDFAKQRYKTNFLGKYRAIDTDGKPYYNDNSKFYLWAKFKSFDKSLEANNEAAEVTLNVIVTVGSLGTGTVAVIATNVTRKILIEAGEEFLKGVVIDWTIQSAMNYYFEDIAIPECYYTNIDLLSLGASGLSEIYKNKAFDISTACITAANQEFMKSGRLDENTFGKGGAECMKGVVIAVVLRGVANNGGRYATLLVNHVNKSPAKFVGFCRKILIWSDDQIREFAAKLNIDVKKLGLDDVNVSGAGKAFKIGDKIAEITVKQVKPGTNGKIAVVGRQMNNHVNDVAAHLKNNQGFQVEILSDNYLNRTFNIDGVEWSVNSAWDDMVDNPAYITMKDPNTGYIKAEYIEQIPMYKLNKQWIEQIQSEGFTIIDIGYPQGLTSESLFYNMEINTINW